MDKAMESIISRKDESIVLKVDNEYRSISISRIYYCEAEDKYQRIYLNNNERLLVRITGTELYKMLSEHTCIYRCGRAHIVNLNHISKITSDSTDSCCCIVRSNTRYKYLFSKCKDTYKK